MKILLIVKSKHIGNTMMVAEAMSEIAPVTICQLEDANCYKLNEYDIVGFGSGIYFGKHDKELFEFVNNASTLPRYSFVFSTSGSHSFDKNNKDLVKVLQNKGIIVLDQFGCKGLDKYFIFKLFGGLNKNHPNTDDFDKAQAFILNVIDKFNIIKNGK